jgi:hypothetical protein
VGLVAVLELGITAALSAAAANWLILHRAQKRYREAAEAQAVKPDLDPQAHKSPEVPEAPVPPGQYDEDDDASGHRIYLNPWAADHEDEWDDDDDEEIPLGVIEEYPEEP